MKKKIYDILVILADFFLKEISLISADPGHDPFQEMDPDPEGRGATNPDSKHCVKP